MKTIKQWWKSLMVSIALKKKQRQQRKIAQMIEDIQIREFEGDLYLTFLDVPLLNAESDEQLLIFLEQTRCTYAEWLSKNNF